MFVFKHKNGAFVERIYKDELGANAETYRHVQYLDRASIFAGWWEVAEWQTRRANVGYALLPAEWMIVEVQLVKNPPIEVVKVIG